jgi:hypothetical protein
MTVETVVRGPFHALAHVCRHGTPLPGVLRGTCVAADQRQGSALLGMLHPVGDRVGKAGYPRSLSEQRHRAHTPPVPTSRRFDDLGRDQVSTVHM